MSINYNRVVLCVTNGKVGNTLPAAESVLAGSLTGAPWPDIISERDNDDAINCRRSSKFKKSIELLRWGVTIATLFCIISPLPLTLAFTLKLLFKELLAPGWSGAGVGGKGDTGGCCCWDAISCPRIDIFMDTPTSTIDRIGQTPTVAVATAAYINYRTVLFSKPVI